MNSMGSDPVLTTVTLEGSDPICVPQLGSTC